jgi:hypothetical protein
MSFTASSISGWLKTLGRSDNSASISRRLAEAGRLLSPCLNYHPDNNATRPGNSGCGNFHVYTSFVIFGFWLLTRSCCPGLSR